MPTDEVNASEPTVETTPPAQPEITEDAIKAHPLFKDLESKHAAARKGLDDKAIELKKLKTAFVGETVEEPTPPAPATVVDLEKTKEQIKWELKHETQISLADKNGLYSKLVSEGKSHQDALDLALYREGIVNDSSKAESVRQQSVSTSTAAVDRSGGSSIEGLPEGYVKKLEAQGLKKDQIQKIVKNARERQAKRS